MNNYRDLSLVFFQFSHPLFVVEKKPAKDHSQEKSEAKADNFASLNSSQHQFADIRSS